MNYEHEELLERSATLDGVLEAALDAYFDAKGLLEAGSISDQALHVRRLGDSLSDLASWLPGYDYETGEVAHPDD